MSKFRVDDKVTFTEQIKEYYRDSERNRQIDEYDLCKMVGHLDEPMTVNRIDGTWIEVSCLAAGVESYMFDKNKLELATTLSPGEDNDKLFCLELTHREIDQLSYHSESYSDSLCQKILDVKNLAVESANKNKVANAIKEKFGIVVENPEVIDLYGDKIVHVHVDKYGGCFAQSVITPDDKSGRFFRFDESLGITEILPKIRVITKTEVDWADKDAN